MKWLKISKKWVIYVVIVALILIGRYFLGLSPISTTREYVHAVVGGQINKAVPLLIGEAKRNVLSQQKQIKTTGDVLKENYNLDSIDWRMQYAVVEGDITVGFTDGTVDREKQRFELLKTNGVWQIAKVEVESPLEATNVITPAFGTDTGAKETATQFLKDQLTGNKEATHFLTGNAYSAYIASKLNRATSLEAQDIKFKTIGREPFGDLLLRVSYTLINKKNHSTGYDVQLLLQMEKVGGVWKIANMESL